MDPIPPPVAPPPVTEKPKSKTWLWILVCLALLFAGISMGVLVGKQIYSQPAPIPTPTPISESLPTPDPTANWETYTDRVWGYTVKYPQEELVYCSEDSPPGLRLWTAPFDCPDGHDTFYEISIFPQNEHNFYKPPVSSKSIQVAGLEASENIIKFDESDGPLAGFGGATVIAVPVANGTIEITLLGEKPEQKARFDQILSTFRFLD